jgi:DNA repair exonuclease SbcCD nuclease subunit
VELHVPQTRDLLIVHSSDLHLGASYRGAPLDPLERVLDVARRLDADAVLLVGDVFDHNRVPLSLIDDATRLLSAAERRVIILPGNHDCLLPASVYHRGGLADPDNVWVLGCSVDQAVQFPDLDLEIWGRPHLDYADMSPLETPRPRSTRWQIAMAHGHWVRDSYDLGRSWLIRDDEIAASAADYVALGHWDVAVQAGDGSVPAFYSGAPDYAGTVNVVRLCADGGVAVSREPVAPALP